MAVDFVGNKVEIGDKVVVCERYYRHFLIGTILKITKTGFQVEYKGNYGTKYFTPYIVKVIKED